MVVSCCVVGCSNRAKKKVSTGFQKSLVNKLRQLLTRGNNFRCYESGLLSFTLYNYGSQGMTNGCQIEKIGIHQNMTGCALITFDKYIFKLAC